MVLLFSRFAAFQEYAGEEYSLSVLLFSGLVAFQGYDWEEYALLVLLISGFSAFQEYDWEEFLQECRVCKKGNHPLHICPLCVDNG